MIILIIIHWKESWLINVTWKDFSVDVEEPVPIVCFFQNSDYTACQSDRQGEL